MKTSTSNKFKSYGVIAATIFGIFSSYMAYSEHVEHKKIQTELELKLQKRQAEEEFFKELTNFLYFNDFCDHIRALAEHTGYVKDKTDDNIGWCVKNAKKVIEEMKKRKKLENKID